VLEVDARGLEPPEPLIRILNALESLPGGATLRARTDREPCHLFGEAAQRGFRHESRVQPDGSWLTVLSRG
jgi:TusA-related sulfurtransferase